MRPFAVSTAVAAVLLIAGCSSGGAPAMDAPAPWSPVGSYEFSTFVQGMGVGGTMVIAGTSDMLSGTITVDPAMGIPPLPIETIEVAGNEVTITADAGGETIFMVLLFAESGTFDGSWSMSGDGGDITGRKTSR